MSEKQTAQPELSVVSAGENEIITKPHILWVGCGDLLRRTMNALLTLKEEHEAVLTFLDICEPDKVKQQVPHGAGFYNVASKPGRSELRKYLRESPLSHIFVANWAPQHILTAFKFSELCEAGHIVISKPLDTNFALIETVEAGAWPDITEKLFVHDHYRNKGAVEPVFQAFPKLIEVYGQINTFEFYLIEHKTAEDEGRLEALNDGVIFDLASHLFALAQLFFLDPPCPALCIPDCQVKSASIRINRVARGRYANCRIRNRNAETFAAIEVTLLIEYTHTRTGKSDPQEIDGLMVVGKGIKPSQSISAGLKGMRFKQELQTRSVNLTRNEVNPPLSNLNFAQLDETAIKEDGFRNPVVMALSRRRRENGDAQDKISPMMPFKQAAINSRLLQQAIRAGSDLVYYQRGDTLEAVLAKCVGANRLDSRWLAEAGYGDIGYG